MIDNGRRTYREFIEFMAELARGSVLADRIRGSGHAERGNESDLPLTEPEVRRKAMLLSMSAEQREVVVQLLEQERIGGIHDVVANLDGFDIRLGGRTLYEQADNEPKSDFMDQIDRWAWQD